MVREFPDSYYLCQEGYVIVIFCSLSEKLWTILMKVLRNAGIKQRNRSSLVVFWIEEGHGPIIFQALKTKEFWGNLLWYVALTAYIILVLVMYSYF